MVLHVYKGPVHLALTIIIVLAHFETRVVAAGGCAGGCATLTFTADSRNAHRRADVPSLCPAAGTLLYLCTIVQ